MPIGKNFSTETTIFNICDNIWTSMENNKLTCIICLDLSAAFYTVNHSILLNVMRNYFGIADMALDWVSCYLRNWKFFCSNWQFLIKNKNNKLLHTSRQHIRPNPFQLLCQYPDGDYIWKWGKLCVWICWWPCSNKYFLPWKYRQLTQTGFKHILHQRLDE